MSEQAPSQAEGERQDDTATDRNRKAQQVTDADVPRTTPSQAEGDRADKEAEESDAWESGWSGP
ncbi:hypothetical protein [Streptomyces sp. NPDC126514]|uniref:hypothetical protein n=1 Tax=Streptomyces sp. NPDC126514 TaxID=3155210 RepID=UPI00332894D3